MVLSGEKTDANSVQELLEGLTKLLGGTSADLAFVEKLRLASRNVFINEKRLLRTDRNKLVCEKSCDCAPAVAAARFCCSNDPVPLFLPVQCWRSAF